MLGVFFISVMLLFAGGTAANKCDDLNLDVKECVHYVKDNSVSEYPKHHD